MVTLGIPRPERSETPDFTPFVKHIKEVQDLQSEYVGDRQKKPFVVGLAGYLRRLWEDAKQEKAHVQQQILDDYRQRDGKYSAQKLQEINQHGGSVIFMTLTGAKCRAAKSWLRDIMVPSKDSKDPEDTQAQPWSIQPSTIPDIPPEWKVHIIQQLVVELEQELAMSGQSLDMQVVSERFQMMQDELLEKVREKAKDAASRMSRRVADQLEEGGWSAAFLEAMDDVVITRAGFVKGPIVRKRKKLGWGLLNEKIRPVVKDVLRPEFERRSPLDIFPSPGAQGIQDGYLFDRQQLTRQDLMAMIGVPGFDDAAIRVVLRKYQDTTLHDELPGDAELLAIQDRSGTLKERTGLIEALEFWGHVPGGMLLDWGMDPNEIDDPSLDYPVNAWLIDDMVIKAVVNDDPLGKRPYAMASFEKLPGSFWGKGIAEIMHDCQDICNASARHLVNNLAISSGPQVVVPDASRFQDGENMEMFPWKVWVLEKGVGVSAGENPISFFQPNSNAQELMAVYDRFSQVADNVTGIPAYMTSGNGQDAQGAGQTASGLAMLMGHASRGLKGVIANIDEGIVAPIISMTYVHNMLFDEDESIKGDAQVVAIGSGVLINREHMMVRQNELMQTLNNPIDNAILGLEGRAAIVRPVTRSVFGVDVVPSEREITKRVQMQQMQQLQLAAQNPQAPPQSARVLDAAGSPAKGQDHALFTQGGHS